MLGIAKPMLSLSMLTLAIATAMQAAAIVAAHVKPSVIIVQQ